MLILWYIMYRRANTKWTVNECLRLEREFDLLGLSIQEIAELHERSPNAIMYKLDYEGIADYNDIFQNRQEKTCKIASEAENEAAANEEGSETEDSEYDETEEDNNNEEDADEAVSESDNEYESYNFGQHIKQIAKLTKQVAYLTKIVYDAFTTKNTTKSFQGQSFAGFH
jgi:hypothetical protein